MTARDPLTATDIRIRGAWERAIPLRLVPYSRLARWDRPIGAWLLLLPCWWGAALAAAGAPGFSALETAWLVALFAVGAFAMRGAGCTYNDIVDRDFDARVSRTAIRPLPAGHTTVFRAWAFIALQGAAGLAVLLALEPGAIMVGLGSIPLVLAYPFMKRLSHWPQAWLGLTFNWGRAGRLGSGPGRGLGAGLRPLRRRHRLDARLRHDLRPPGQGGRLRWWASNRRRSCSAARTRPWVAGFYGAALALLALAGWLAGLGWPFYAGLAVVGAQFAWQVHRLDIDDPDRWPRALQVQPPRRPAGPRSHRAGHVSLAPAPPRARRRCAGPRERRRPRRG